MKERTPSVCFAASSLKEGALPHGQPPSPREVASRSDDGRSSFHVFHCFQYIPPRFFCQQKQPEKKKKAMENFHRFAGASCLTRTGDTLINSQVL